MRILNIFLHQFQLQLIDLKKYSFTEISEQNLTVTAQKVNIKTNYIILMMQQHWQVHRLQRIFFVEFSAQSTTNHQDPIPIVLSH